MREQRGGGGASKIILSQRRELLEGSQSHVERPELSKSRTLCMLSYSISAETCSKHCKLL
jgi:hypothetical protein